MLRCVALTNNKMPWKRMQGSSNACNPAHKEAVGQMQAIQFANQLASAQGNQLLQIRGLLIAQQNAIATRNQALADREAQEAAASEQLRMGDFKASSGQQW